MKFVLTGGPGVGKTTVVNALRDLGFTVLPETARAIIEEGKLGPHLNFNDFEKEVLARQVQQERNCILPYDEPVFLDRGIHDVEAYCRNRGEDPPQEYDHLVSNYDIAFLFEPLQGDIEKDGVRMHFETSQFVREITPLFEKCYTEAGVPVVRVSCAPVEVRINTILGTCSRFRQSSRR